MHTLLARTAGGRPVDCAVAERHAVEDLWRDPLVNRRWQRLALRLCATDCVRIGRLAADRGLAGERRALDHRRVGHGRLGAGIEGVRRCA